MFDSSVVVQSAISSFNNAALVGPSFLWSAVFMLPLFALVYFFGNAFLERLGWDPKKRVFNFALCSEIAIWGWLVLMAGNYAALRDASSILPFVIAATVFVLTASIIQKLKDINPKMPESWQTLKYRRLWKCLIFIAITAVVALSGVHTWWGILMQGAAFVSGLVVGLASRKYRITPIFMTTVIMFVATTMLLMQPEFFRFGQLGSLTIFHIIALMITGGLLMSVLATRYINARARIHQSAFVKIKWLVRFMLALCVVLFVFTESVPVFFGFIGMAFLLFAMSVWHNESVSENLNKKLWALSLCAFGIVASLPLITALGILYWVNLPRGALAKQAKFLL